jgi:hypothetical protein
MRLSKLTELLEKSAIPGKDPFVFFRSKAGDVYHIDCVTTCNHLSAHLEDEDLELREFLDDVDRRTTHYDP